MLGRMSKMRQNRDLFSGRAKGKFDWLLFLCLYALIIVGVLAISNATVDPYQEVEGSGFLAQLDRLLTYSTTYQLIWVAVGTVAFFVAFLLLDYRVYGEFALLIYIVANAMLAVVLFLPQVAGINAFVQWMEDRTFQPSELCKVAIIVTLAKHISQREEKITSIKDFIPYFIHFAIPFGLVILQDDYGSAMVFLAIFIGMLFVAGMSWKLFVGLGAAGAAGVVAIFPFLSEFRQNRILDFIDPSRNIDASGHQVYYSKIAVGSGQFFGKGLFEEGNISQLDFVPVKHTDFIFAVTAESVGFVGAMIILALYFFLLVRLFRTSFKTADSFGALIIAGVGSMLLFHIFENIAMTIGLMPVTGIPLPFISYGGSSMLANMLAMGLVFNVNRNQQRSLF